MKLFREVPHFAFMKNRFIFLGMSGAIVALSLFFIFTKGLNYGTDFMGGVKLQYQFPKTVSDGEIRKTLMDLHLGDVSVVRYGRAEENRFVIKVSKPALDTTTLSPTITPVLTRAFGEQGLVLEKEESVGPKVGQELRRKGLMTVLFSLFCMLVYIGFRFDFYFAPGAIVALFHDVIVTLGIFALLQLEFNLTILAAVLTIVGYSLNDTIIVFDRIREHTRLINPESIEEVVNTSINETLARTLITSMIVFFVVMVLFFFGGATIKDFAFAFVIGVITGTYSTFSIACPIYIAMYRHFPKVQSALGKKG
ncbi:MAG: protein translocase subunit SecF [Deltaproteobacteria bacterium]|nr:protein translocase subunit SecF [Deltaproteobacteria bacterium]